MLYKYRKIYTWQCRYILHIGYFNWVERFQKIDNYFFGAALCDRFLWRLETSIYKKYSHSNGKKKLYYIQNRGVRINFFSGSFLGNFDFHRSINWYGIRL